MNVLILNFVDANTFAMLPPTVTGAPTVYTIAGNQIKIWPAPSDALLATGFTLQMNVKTGAASAIAVAS